MTLPWPLASSVSTMQQIVAAIASAWSVEHKATGAHNWRWATVPYNASRFQGDGTITWTVEAGDHKHEYYGVLGDLMAWALRIGGSSTGGAASKRLRVMLPAGYRVATTCGFPVSYVVTGGQSLSGFLEGEANARYVSIRKSDDTNWDNASSNATFLDFFVWLRVTK